MQDKQWSSKLVHKEGKNFFIRTIKLNPFPTYLNVIIVKSTMQKWYDYLVKEKSIDIWQKLLNIQPDEGDGYDKMDEELVKDFLNNEHNKDAPGASSGNGGVCIFPTKGNQWFMLIKEHDSVKKCLMILVHEIQHVVQRLSINRAIDMSIWATTEIFSYMTDMIFGELFDDIVKQYSLF